MALDRDVLDEIDVLVRGGFEARDDIVEILCEEMFEPGELSATDVADAVDAAIARHNLDQRAWPAVTDCDRLDAVFAALNAQGIVALQNAGYTQSDGHSDITEAWQNLPNPDTAFGYCFYHGQDLARAVRDEGLWLAFGPLDADKEASEGPRIGALIVAELQRAGFATQWNGTFDERIGVPRIDWKKR